MVTLHGYHGHWTCLFPQHGPGKKSDRPIVLEPWQAQLVPRALRVPPRVHPLGRLRLRQPDGQYAYESYSFSNLSPDILRLFARTCALAGVECRVYRKYVAIYRRASVARMLEHVGRKA